jgi:teichoic acid transport system permease protein
MANVTATAHPGQPDLYPADQGVGFGSYVRELWHRRDYVRYVASSELRSQQMNTVLGNLWHLLNPALQIAVFYLIFGVILGVTRGVDNLLAFMSVGLFSYQYSTTSVTMGAKSITGNRPLLRSIWFPRAMLPVTTTTTQLFAFLPKLVVMLAVCLVTGEPALVTWLLVPGILVLQSTLNLGLALMAARAGNHVADLQNLLPFIFRMLLYGSGVLFLIDEYVVQSKYQLLFELNPFYGIIAIWRWAILDYSLAPRLAAYTAITSILTLTAGVVWFRRGERGYTDGV